MGTSDKVGQARAETRLESPQLSNILHFLWEELVTVTRQLTQIDLDGEEAPEQLHSGQQRQIELREQINQAACTSGYHPHKYLEECLLWERRLQDSLQTARERYRQPHSDLQQGKRLRAVYNKTTGVEAYFVNKSR